MNLNGMSTAQIISPVKFEFGEAQVTAMIAQVKKVAGSGGAIPVNDPASLLVLGVVMEKLAEISARLAALEAV